MELLCWKTKMIEKCERKYASQLNYEKYLCTLTFFNKWIYFIFYFNQPPYYVQGTCVVPCGSIYLYTLIYVHLLLQFTYVYTTLLPYITLKQHSQQLSQHTYPLFDTKWLPSNLSTCTLCQ